MIVELGFPSLDLYNNLKFNFSDVIKYDLYLSHPHFYHFYIREGSSIIANLLFSLYDGAVHIYYISINSDYRKKGLSKLLLNRLIEHSNNLKCYKITSHIKESNTISINLHKWFGFKKVKRDHITKYKNGEIKIRFIKKLISI